MTEMNRAQRRAQLRREGSKNRKNRSKLAGLSMLATTTLFGAGVSYLRPVSAYATDPCNVNLASLPNNNRTIGAQTFQYMIDDALVAHCSTLTLSASELFTVSVTDTLDVFEGFSFDAASVSRANGIATVTTTLPHGLIAGDRVRLNLSDNRVDGDFTVLTAAGTEFTVASAGVPISEPEVSGSVQELLDFKIVGPGRDKLHIVAGQVNGQVFGDSLLWLGEGEVEISGITFSGARATGDGGAIYSYAEDLSLDGVWFVDNQAFSGGAIYQYSSYGRGFETNLEIRNSRFIENEAGSRGGAISADDISEISNSHFEGNRTGSSDGGAIEADDITLIDNSDFILNESGEDGGAVEADDIGVIQFSTFSRNVADDEGGAIEADDIGLILDSNFLNNHARRDGGAIESDDIASIEESVFTENTSTGEGGAVYADNIGVINIDSVDFYDGYAIIDTEVPHLLDTGDTISIVEAYAEELNLTNVTVEVLEFDRIKLVNNSFREVNPDPDGGQIITDRTLGVLNSTFTGNGSGQVEVVSVSVEGGVATLVTAVPHGLSVGDQVKLDLSEDRFDGEFEVTATPTLKSFEFTIVNENLSSILVTGDVQIFGSGYEGGAIYADLDIALISGSTFIGNFASHAGGALYADDIFVLSNSEFRDNESLDSRGGAIRSDDIGMISTSFFNANKSRWNGGAISSGNIFSIDQSTFVDNSSARGLGGAISAEKIGLTGGFVDIYDQDVPVVFSQVPHGLVAGDSIFIEDSDLPDQVVTVDQVLSPRRFTVANIGGLGGSVHFAKVVGNQVRSGIHSSTFSLNTAEGGGAVHSRRIELISNSTFFNNDISEGPHAGRAVLISDFLDAGDNRIESSTIWNSQANLGVAQLGEVAITYGSLISRNSVIANASERPSVFLRLDGGGDSTPINSFHSFLTGVNVNGSDVPLSEWGPGPAGNQQGSNPGLENSLLTQTGNTTHIGVLRPTRTSLLINAGDPAGAGTLTVDQRGLNRIVGTAIDIGAVELLASEIQESTPVVPVASNSIPTSVTLTPRTAAPGQSATISGPGTANILRVSVAGQSVAFTRQADGRISFAVPTGLKPGVYDVEMTLDLGQIITREKITISGAIKTRNLLYTNFVGDRSVLPSSARSGITAALAGFKNVTKVVCIGSTSGTRATAADRRLAQQRAQAACNLVKRIRPDVVVELRTRPASGVGARFRSVTIQIQGS